ncbi:MAG TPA: hypothetical protein VFT65_00820, partial [Candidatus Angelobacter sp.]|nr:hypothetical protein [Candidatus Angelobacter sp.]
MRSKIALCMVFSAHLLLIGCGGGGVASSSNFVPVPTPTQAPSATPSPTPAFPAADHVFVVVLENHAFAQVIGSPSMPYLNSLATQHALATNYFANTHPSIGNYFMLTTA